MEKLVPGKYLFLKLQQDIVRVLQRLSRQVGSCISRAEIINPSMHWVYFYKTSIPIASFKLATYFLNLFQWHLQKRCNESQTKRT